MATKDRSLTPINLKWKGRKGGCISQGLLTQGMSYRGKGTGDSGGGSSNWEAKAAE